MKRVVVTGLGAITPLGNNVSEFWDNLVKGTCGIKEITKFDTTNYKVKLAAEVHQFDPLQYMDKIASHRPLCTICYGGSLPSYGRQRHSKYHSP